MFGRSKFMHIPAEDVDVVAEFEAGQIHDLVAFCGQPIARACGWLPSIGGAKRDAPICPDCAYADGWDYDPNTGQWTSPYDEEVCR